MTHTILIIEDNQSDYNRTISMLNEINLQTSNKYDYAPKSEGDFGKIRSKFNFLNCPKQDIYDSSMKYLLELTRSIDLILLDYQLIESPPFMSKIKTGLDLYNVLKLEKKALIYTSSNDYEIENIRTEISDCGLADRIKVIKKPKKQNEEAISYLRSNIEKMLQ